MLHINMFNVYKNHHFLHKVILLLVWPNKKNQTFSLNKLPHLLAYKIEFSTFISEEFC